jgi:hypothetical protein
MANHEILRNLHAPLKPSRISGYRGERSLPHVVCRNTGKLAAVAGYDSVTWVRVGAITPDRPRGQGQSSVTPAWCTTVDI